jgi:peptidoglycan/xylan/chitin deacetylase (PgdA/CDA1 family)
MAAWSERMCAPSRYRTETGTSMPAARPSLAVILAALLALLALPGRAASAEEAQRGTAVLTYHRFDPTGFGPTKVTDNVFEEQLQFLVSHHVRVGTLHQLLDSMRAGTPDTGLPPPPPPCVVITADDGHRSVYTHMLPLIRRYRVPVTLFIYPAGISHGPQELTWEQLQELKATGLVEIEAHSLTHPHFHFEENVRGADDYRDFVTRELEESKAQLQDKLGIQVDMMAWPYGIHDTDLERAAQQAGYRAAFAINPRLVKPGEDMFALPRTVISEADRGARFAAIVEAACPEIKVPKLLAVRSGPKLPESAPLGLVPLKRARDGLNGLD